MLVSGVPMRDQNNDENRYFFPNWAVRSAVIIKGRKNAVFVGKGYVSYEFYRRLQNKRVSVLIYYTGKGYFLTGHNENGYQLQNVEHSV